MKVLCFFGSWLVNGKMRRKLEIFIKKIEIFFKNFQTR